MEGEAGELKRIADAMERIAVALESRSQPEPHRPSAISDKFDGPRDAWWSMVRTPVREAAAVLVARMVWPKGGDAGGEKSHLVRRVTKAAAGEQDEMRSLSSALDRLNQLNLLDFLRMPSFIRGSAKQNYRDRVIEANTPKDGS